MRGSIEVQGAAGDPPKQYTFDNVFGADSKQADIYNEVIGLCCCNRCCCMLVY